MEHRTITDNRAGNSGRLDVDPGEATRRRRRMISSVMTTLTAACSLLVIALLIMILGYIGVRGLSSISLQFLIDTPKPVGEGGGIGNAIVGSLIMTGLASLIGLPIGIAAGVYLAEYGNSWYGKTVRFVADTMTGVPSIIVGIFVYTSLSCLDDNRDAVSWH